jgi:hypothetical protein
LQHSWGWALFPPALKFRDLAAHVCTLFRRKSPDHFDYLIEPVLTFSDLREDLVPQEACVELAQCGHRLEMRRLAVGEHHLSNGTKRARAPKRPLPLNLRPLVGGYFFLLAVFLTGLARMLETTDARFDPAASEILRDTRKL